MNQKIFFNLLKYLIALVWLVNGIYCKVLGYVPRHQAIVAEILGEQYDKELIVLIGLSEVEIVIWVLSEYRVKSCATLQIAVVGLMNILEFSLVPHLLLWGRLNIVFAGIFILVVYYYGFVLRLSKVRISSRK